MNEIYNALSQAIRDGELEDGIREFDILLDQGVSPLNVFLECVEPTLNDLGEKFSKMEIFLPELMIAADVVTGIQEKAEPLLAANSQSVGNRGTVVIATVFGDIHDIGKNMVALMLKVNGFNVHDLGVDISPQQLVKKAEDTGADLLCLSGLMLPSLPYMRETIELVKGNKQLQEKTKVLVGGGPVTEKWAADNGADGYADDAMGAVRLAVQVMGKE